MSTAPEPPGPDLPRIGYCCIWLPPDDDAAEKRRMNTAGTTVAALSRLGRAEAYAKVLGLVRHNVEALRLQVARVASLPPIQRMLRFESGILPLYTHQVARWMYDVPEMREVVERGLGAVGEAARTAGVRVSLHPGQFCVLGTTSDSVRAASVAEVEYHAELMRWMGYADSWHPHGAHINVHLGSAAAGSAGFRAGLGLCSAAARNLLTVENDETTFGLDDLLPLAEDLPIVLDLHHHWLHSRGEYIRPDDPRIARVRDSWRGVRPVSHLSVSREDVLPGHPADRLPDYAALAAAGLRARDLRAHSDLLWNTAVNEWAASHLAWTDIEVEAKHKNRASAQLARHAESRAQAA